jgi:hypothetical protein
MRPDTAPHQKALRQLEAGEGVTDADDISNDCRYLIYISYRGLDNWMLAIAAAFLYSPCSPTASSSSMASRMSMTFSASCIWLNQRRPKGEGGGAAGGVGACGIFG